MGNKEKLSIPVMLFCIVGVVLIGLGIMLLLSYNFKLNVIYETALNKLEEPDDFKDIINGTTPVSQWKDIVNVSEKYKQLKKFWLCSSFKNLSQIGN